MLFRNTIYDSVDVFAEELDRDLLAHTLSFDLTDNAAGVIN